VTFPDYPKLSVWPDAYYLTVNLFANGSTFAGAGVAALDRSKMLAGQPATQQLFYTRTAYGGLLASTLDGSRLPPAGSPNYLVALGTTSSLATWQYHVDWTTPSNSTFSGPPSLGVGAYSEAGARATAIHQSGAPSRHSPLTRAAPPVPRAPRPRPAGPAAPGRRHDRQRRWGPDRAPAPLG